MSLRENSFYNIRKYSQSEAKKDIAIKKNQITLIPQSTTQVKYIIYLIREQQQTGSDSLLAGR